MAAPSEEMKARPGTRLGRIRISNREINARYNFLKVRLGESNKMDQNVGN
jgi:hypothetical protein